MAERIIFTEEADDELAEAYDWYETREPGLGEDFIRCVDACVEGLRRHPMMYPVAFGSVHRALIRRFPFELFYEPLPDALKIHAVFHCSRNPKLLRKRLR